MEKKMRMEIDQMPPRGAYHRRAHSDTTFRFDDLLLFDPSDLDLSCLDLPDSFPNPVLPPVAPVPTESSDDSSSNFPPRSAENNPRQISSHRRSHSVDSDFFEGPGLTGPAISGGAGDEEFGGKRGVGEKGVQHRHSNSMDGSTTTSFDLDSLMAVDGIKKAMPPDRLAELALIDPKRAKRILANRQSAARSKERKIRYTSELEKKVQTLQTEATNLSAQVKRLQRDTSGLTTENKELKLRLQALEQQAHLRDALHEKLREEVQRLRIQAGQVSVVNGNPLNRGVPPQILPHQPAPHPFGVLQRPPQQQQMPQSCTTNQTLNGQPQARFTDFNQRA